MIQDGLNALAFEDDLTGLQNRRALLKYLNDNIPWKEPKGAHPTGLVLFGMDTFRKINDSLGQSEGDFALQQFAERLRGAFRPGDLVVRLRGDVFAAVLPGFGRDQALEAAERLRAGVEQTPLRSRRDKTSLGLTISCGIAAFPADGDDPEMFIEAADRALYHAKKAGKNRSSVAGTLDYSLMADRDRFAGFPCRTFVGRDGEVEKAREIIKGLKERKSSILFVQGPSGVGKSRYLRELIKEANKAQVLYLHTLCTEANRMAVGSALTYITDRYFERHPDAQEKLRGRLKPAQRFIARQILPSLLNWRPEAIEPQARDRKLLTLQVLETAVVLMAESMPTLVLLDNVHNADRATFDILRVILREKKAPIAVVLTLRKDIQSLDRNREPVLVEFAEQFIQDPRLTMVTMSPLKRDDLVLMMDTILPATPRPPGFDDAVILRSQGNPLYVEEALRDLILRDRIVKKGEGYEFVSQNLVGDLPVNVDAAVQAVLNHLPPETSDLLTNAAIVGTKFDIQLLQEVMGTREAATLAAVEKAKTTRIIRVSTDEGDDHLEFSSEHTRDVRYTTIPEEKRSSTHRRIATVGEARQRPASEIAFHNNQANGITPSILDENAEFVPGAPPVRVPRVQEGKAPVGPEETKKLIAMLRAFSGLLKVGRLYPQWSTTSAQFRSQLGQTLTDLLATTTVVTLTSESSGMKVNGQEIEAARAGEAVSEFSTLLSDRLITSITLQQGLEDREIDSLVKALTDPMKASQTPVDHWDRFLDRENIRHADVLQRRYVAREGESMRILRREVPVERPLEPAEIESLQATLRFLKAASDNLKLYPPGHAAVEESISQASVGFIGLVSTLRLLSLASVDDKLIVNGVALSLGDAGAWLHDELATRDLKSLTIVDNLRTDEVQALVSVLSIPANDPAAATQVEKVMGGNEIRHFTFGARVYARVQAGPPTGEEPAPVEVPEAPPPAADAEPPPTIVSETSRRDVRADLRARLYVKLPPDQLLTEAFEKEFVPLVEALNFGWTKGLAAELIAHVAGFTLVKQPGHREAALRILARSFRDLTGESRTLLMNTTKPTLEQHIERESDEDVLESSVEVIRYWLDLALSQQKLKEVSELLTHITTVQMDGTLHQYRSGIMSKLTSLATPERVQMFLATLKSDVAAMRDSASMILGALGPKMIPPLLRFVKETDELPARTAAAFALHAIGGNAQTDLGGELGAASPEEGIRILQVLERSGVGPLATPILASIHHKDDRIREAAWDLIQRITERPVIAAILRKLLSTEPPPIQKRAIWIAAKMAVKDLTPDVGRILQSTEDDAVARAACEFFRTVPSIAAVPALQRIFDTKPKMFGIVKGFSEETRAAAVTAARAAPCRDTTSLLEDARKDGSPAVRRAAQ